MARKQETVTPNTWIDQAMEKIREQIATKADQQMVDVIIEIYNGTWKSYEDYYTQMLEFKSHLDKLNQQRGNIILYYSPFIISEDMYDYITSKRVAKGLFN